MIRSFWHRRRFMREHHWTNANLSEYLDGELADAEQARVERHIGLCPECHRVLAGLRKTLAALMQLRTDVDVDVATGVIARLRSEP